MKKDKIEVFDDINKKLSNIKKQNEMLSEFQLELEKLKTLDAKKKILWAQIYQNAVDDRNSALMLFTAAYAGMNQSPSDHIAMGGILVKYLEKMTKSNQQLIDLSLLIAKDEEQNDQIDPDDLFKEISEDEE